MLTQIFSTPLYQTRPDASAEQLERLTHYLLGLRDSDPGEVRSNQGGWHSSGNLLDGNHPCLAFLKGVVSHAALEYVGKAFGWRGEIRFRAQAWAVINRPGDYNTPHNHLNSLVSGVFYVHTPPDMSGGEIVLMDPRFNLKRHDSSGPDREHHSIPWDNDKLALAPTSGDLLMFPSWLVHFVHGYRSGAADAVRVVVSFNLSA